MSADGNARLARNKRHGTVRNLRGGVRGGATEFGSWGGRAGAEPLSHGAELEREVAERQREHNVKHERDPRDQTHQ